jgi:transposase
MAMGKKRWRQQPMWIANQELPRSRGHVFYDRVNEILKSEKFDEFAEKECVSFYKSETRGRPSTAPGVYFRMVMIGYFEGMTRNAESHGDARIH